MKLAVLVPSAQYKDYAGARIRYGRLAPELMKSGIDLAVEDIADFDPLKADCDVLLISKCQDARSLVAGAILSERGCLVGVDLFDDYFSQTGDSRLARYRTWLSELLQICDFALCSTAAMSAVVDLYRADIPRHVINDPGPAVDKKRLTAILARKAAEARDCGCARVAWFGVGDNPRFRVGLDDLAAFGGALRELTGSGVDVELRVLTNARALSADGLAGIGRLPVRTQVQEWSEDRERALLKDAFAVFLPVSGQSFSTAKSLNRAVTALSAGCQVLSVGYPLYDVFDPLIYRDAGDLGRDLVSGEPRFSPERVEMYSELVTQFASADAEAAGLANFLQRLKRSARRAGPLALVHGHATNGIAHKMVHAAGGLSVASPFATAPLGYDIIFREAVGRLTMLVSAKAAQRLRPDAKSRIQGAQTINDRKFIEVGDSGAGASGLLMCSSQASLPAQLATYARAMSVIRRRLTESFAPSRIMISETSPLPFALAGED